MSRASVSMPLPVHIVENGNQNKTATKAHSCVMSLHFFHSTCQREKKLFNCGASRHIEKQKLKC